MWQRYSTQLAPSIPLHIACTLEAILLASALATSWRHTRPYTSLSSASRAAAFLMAVNVLVPLVTWVSTISSTEAVSGGFRLYTRPMALDPELLAMLGVNTVCTVLGVARCGYYAYTLHKKAVELAKVQCTEVNEFVEMLFWSRQMGYVAAMLVPGLQHATVIVMIRIGVWSKWVAAVSVVFGVVAIMNARIVSPRGFA